MFELSKLVKGKYHNRRVKTVVFCHDNHYQTERVKHSAASVFEVIVNRYVNRDSYVNHLGDGRNYYVCRMSRVGSHFPTTPLSHPGWSHWLWCEIAQCHTGASHWKKKTTFVSKKIFSTIVSKKICSIFYQTIFFLIFLEHFFLSIFFPEFFP
jgi:hypothetical protein